MENTTKQKIAIVGAGLAGLSAAKELESSAEVTVFDKSRGVGGRLATRMQTHISSITGRSTLP